MPANTEPTITLTRATHERGNATTARLLNGTSVVAITAAGTATDAAMTAFAERITVASEQLRPAALMREVQVQAQGVVKAIGFDRDVLAHDKANLDQANEAGRRPLASVSREWAVADVERLSTMTLPEQMQHLANPVSLEELTAYVSAGQSRLGVTDEAWALIDRAYLRANFIESTGLSAGYRARPSMDALLASGPDQQAVQAAADAVLAKHEQRAADIAQRETHLRSAIVLLAAVLETHPDVILDQVLAA